jgi:hypothetical protein
MNQPTGPTLSKSRAAAALSGLARQVHQAVLSALTRTGRVPARAELDRVARACGGDPAAVVAELARLDVIAFAADGEVRAAYPFSPSATPIQVTWSGGPATYAMCAIDALGMSAMLGHPVTITAEEPGSGRVIVVEADRDRARWHPRTAVVLAADPAGDASRPAADRCCGHINFFASARAARAWARRHPEITGTVLTRKGALRCGIAEFGGMMHPDDRPPG